MNLSITLVHNKSDQKNFDQVETLKSMLTEVTDGPFQDEDGFEYTTTHHEITGLGITHTVKVYQVVPYGVTPPTNCYSINSGGIVHYGSGDEDKTGDHPRFFNWGLKRGTDNGADVSLYIENIAKFKPKQLINKMEKLKDKGDPSEFMQEDGLKMANVKFIQKGGLPNG